MTVVHTQQIVELAQASFFAPRLACDLSLTALHQHTAPTVG
jgi:hypothetical protein